MGHVDQRDQGGQASKIASQGPCFGRRWTDADAAEDAAVPLLGSHGNENVPVPVSMLNVGVGPEVGVGRRIEGSEFGARLTHAFAAGA